MLYMIWDDLEKLYIWLLFILLELGQRQSQISTPHDKLGSKEIWVNKKIWVQKMLGVTNYGS